ncbi:MAG: hypothetical protein Q9182_004107 [Xanthomendoza sp. 2 TL-2023]
MASCSKEHLEYMIDHVILPPKLPDTAEDSEFVVAAEEALMDMVLLVVEQFQQQCSPDYKEPWLIIQRMVSRWVETEPSHGLSKELLTTTFLSMEPQDALPVRIRAQNAGIIFRQRDDAIIIECFELSSRSENVLACNGGQRRLFPAHAVAVPIEVATDTQFRREFFTMLGRLDLEVVNKMMPVSEKAKSHWMEARDTCHPGLVTEMLMATLGAVGHPCKICQVPKRIRDDVVCANGILPWRRSTLWLLVRVSIQTTLTMQVDAATAATIYKNFIVYFLTKLLGLAPSLNLGADKCKVIQMKTARRMVKLGTVVLPFVQEAALATARTVVDSHRELWQTIQTADAQRETRINLDNIEEDTTLTLHNSRTALDRALEGVRHGPQPSFDIPSGYPDWSTIPDGQLPLIDPAIKSVTEKIHALTEIEHWVSQSLPSWLEQALLNARSSHCSLLVESAQRYKEVAQQAYGDPEQLSVMLLTIGNLWCALDKIACSLIPLLHHYPPEIPSDVFSPLLLPKKLQMQQLHALQAYIDGRHLGTEFPAPSIFADPAPEDLHCFAYRYFDQSSTLKEFRKEVEADASADWDAKEKEWKKGTEDYKESTNEWTALVCNNILRDGSISHIRKHCERCSLKSKTDGMTIDVFEWPLPKDEVHCRQAVLELRCPVELAAWRNLTWMVVHDLGRPSQTTGTASHSQLLDFKGLSRYVRPRSSRIVLAASVKSINAFHIRKRRYPVELDSLYSDHRRHYKYFDHTRETWISEQTEQPSFSTQCQTLLHEVPYLNLQYAIDSTVHSQNDVLAGQSECRAEMSLHEYIAYGSLRADGETTQWLNVSRELKALNLTWNNESVCSLIRQVAWQAGSHSTSYLRTTHRVFEVAEFSAELLSNVQDMLRSIKDNWQCSYTMNSLIIILLRTLSLTSSENCRAKALSLLQECRSTLFRWTCGLQNLLRATTEEKHTSRVQQSLLRVALLCKSTFDAETSSTETVIATSEDLWYWAACSMTVQDNTPNTTDCLPTDLQHLLVEDTKFTHRIYRRLQQILTTSKDNTGLDQAITQAWSSFQSTDEVWKYHGGLEGRWIYKKVSSDIARQTVSYNLLSGELVVDGRPLGVLPKTYSNNSAFTRIFGLQKLRVCASDMPGMPYMTANEEHGYLFYFGFRETELVIRAKLDSAVLELIPHNVFFGDLPTILVEDFTHWLDLGTSTVEFRPLSHKWTINQQNWRLIYDPRGSSHLQNPEARLVDIRSRTCQSAHHVLGKLEVAAFMHVTRPLKSKLQVVLPRLGLQFFANDKNEIECLELRKVVDQNQSIGTLVGLQNRLVLCAKGETSKSLDRLVLIPMGVVTAAYEDGRSSVMITTSGREVECLRYQLDAILNRVEGDGTMLSRLYQAYLHALTSQILPDPLTGILGMEQSLKILQEQVLRCCKPLEASEMEMLELIAGLTPPWVFYPAHLQIMQKVTWRNDLSSLCQHPDFASLAERILAQSRKFEILYQGVALVPGLKFHGMKSLRERAKVRNSLFLNVDYGGDKPTSDHDKYYPARDSGQFSDRSIRVYEMSSLVARWSGNMAVAANLVASWAAWDLATGFGTVFDFSQSVSDMLKIKLETWGGSLYEYCRSATREASLYRLLFTFSQISYGLNVSTLDTLEHLKILLAFATNESLQGLGPFPHRGSFNLKLGSAPTPDVLKSIVEESQKPFSLSRENLPQRSRNRERTEYNKVFKKDVRIAVKFYEDEWPCREPREIPVTQVKWLYRGSLQQAMRDRFLDWHKNREIECHLESIQAIINTTMTSIVELLYEESAWHQTEIKGLKRLDRRLPTMASLMTEKCPDLPALPSVLRDKQNKTMLLNNPALRSLIQNFGPNCEDGKVTFRTEYKSNLLKSLDAFHQRPETVLPDKIPQPIAKKALSSFQLCQEHYGREFNTLSDVLMPDEPMHRLVELAGLWPRLRGRDFLSMVATSFNRDVPKEWQESIIAIGLGITILQRARRLAIAVENDDAFAFFREMENPGHTTWSPHERPDWLLIEIDGDFLIRPVQVRVAMEMISPLSSTNTLMQLNMGEGKSSVITPLIATTLADGRRLVRVVVLRSLAKQMERSLIQRLSGLVNRPVYLMPFSRKTEVDEATILKIKELYDECMANRGILIAQPEHILSLKLKGIERLANSSVFIGTKLMKTQTWLDDTCRDILDESDEILDVKFQLVYTLGPQRPIDGQPDRWLVMQSVFDLVEHNSYALQSLLPDQIEVERQAGGRFPTIQVLSSNVRQLLITRVCEDICDSKIPGLAMSTLPPVVKKAANYLITKSSVSEEDCKIVERHYLKDESYIKKLLFVRGLIAGGILFHILFSKRWSVNYGLHPIRCLCAVPYRAKGVPAPAAEFGHPDVTIALTCLSYYYTGLADDQILACLDLLQKSDDPSAEYSTWTRADPSFPANLRYWSSVNLEDHRQCREQLFPGLRFNKKTADYFMANIVFPREGKEFDLKLSTSGWDIPAKPGSTNITTGFSGTNDSRFSLPSFISQHDVPALSHTSGKVLEILAKPENLAYFCAKADKGGLLTSVGLLEFVQQSDTRARVLIDVGAQILDLSNDEVVTQWLSLLPDAAAGVYFDANDHAMVKTRAGKVERLTSSSFLGRMDQCVVYLDEVHTRGTDLKLPSTARAAVTLGPRLTKDRLVQACMRLRQLGHGQSLMFIAPPEVHQSILDTTKMPAVQINGLHVVEWALEQSCLQIDRNQPLRVFHGLNYYRRQSAIERLSRRLPDLSEANENGIQSATRNIMTRDIVEHEAQSLRDLYAPEAMRKGSGPDLVKSSRSNPDKAVQDLLEIWDEIDPQLSQGVNLNEELEREVGHEAEKETQIEKPPKPAPEKPRIDPKLKAFIRSGTLDAVSMLASVYNGVLQHTSPYLFLKRRAETWRNLHVSNDFIRTVKSSNISLTDSHVRPVHWVLVSKDSEVQSVVLISQYEVNQCFNEIQDPSSRVILVVYEPRVTKSMASLDSCLLQPLPLAKAAWENLSDIVRQELHLFAGQLYFTSFEEYERLAGTLASETPPRTAAPLGFIKEWMGLRRKGQNYNPTHVGQLVNGTVLLKEMFETAEEEDLFMTDAEDSVAS